MNQPLKVLRRKYIYTEFRQTPENDTSDNPFCLLIKLKYIFMHGHTIEHILCLYYVFCVCISRYLCAQINTPSIHTERMFCIWLFIYMQDMCMANIYGNG